MSDELEVPLNAAQFTAGDVALVAGVTRGHVDVWVHRGVIKPTRPVRGRPLFSVVAIFEAKLVRVLGEVTIRPAEWSEVSEIIQAVISDDWMYSVARSVERNTHLKNDLFISIGRRNKRWAYVLHVAGEKLQADFGPEAGFLVLPIGRIFASVYAKCREIYSAPNSNWKNKDDARS